MVYNQTEQFDSGWRLQRKPQKPQCFGAFFYLDLCSFWALGTIGAQTQKEGKAIYQSFFQTVPKVLFPLYCFGLLYILPEQCPHQRIACAFLALFQNVCILPQHKAGVGMADKLLYGFWVLARVKHVSHNRMPEIMQPHTLQAHFLRRLLEVMRTQIRRQHLPGVVNEKIRDLDSQIFADFLFTSIRTVHKNRSASVSIIERGVDGGRNRRVFALYGFSG